MTEAKLFFYLIAPTRIDIEGMILGMTSALQHDQDSETETHTALYMPIVVDRSALTIMGVTFPTLELLENTAAALGTNMFEGFRPSPKSIEIIRDYCLGSITFAQVAAIARNGLYE